MNDPPHSRPVAPLNYAGRIQDDDGARARARARDAQVLAVLLRLGFTLGLILLLYGLGLAIKARPDAEGFMAWGGALIGLTAPFGPPWRPRGHSEPNP